MNDKDFLRRFFGVPTDQTLRKRFKDIAFPIDEVVELIDEFAKQNANARQVETLVIPPVGFRLLTDDDTLRYGDAYYINNKWEPIPQNSLNTQYFEALYKPVMRAV